MNAKVVRAILFNLWLYAAAIAFFVSIETQQLGVGFGALVAMWIPLLSGLEPSEAKTSFNGRDYAIWYGGVIAVSIVAVCVTQLVRNLDFLMLEAFSIMTWAFSFLAVRDSLLAAGKISRQPAG